MSRFRTSYIVSKLKNWHNETFESQVVIHNQKFRYYKKNELYMLNGTPKLKSHFVSLCVKPKDQLFKKREETRHQKKEDV